jgi:hypothetical protein
MRGRRFDSGLRLWSLDEMTSDVFAQLRRGNRQIVIAAVVVDDERKQEIALYYRPPSDLARQRFKSDERVPALAFALPNARYRLSSYRRTSRAELEGLSELWVQPDRPTKVFLSDADGLRALSVNEAASVVADCLRAGFVRRFTTPDPLPRLGPVAAQDPRRTRLGRAPKGTVALSVQMIA